MPLPAILDSLHQTSSPRPTVVLAKIHIMHPPVGENWGAPSLNASKDDIIRLWSDLNLDPAMFDSIHMGIRGFYQHHRLPSNQPDSLQFAFSAYTYCIIWNYCIRTRATSGVIIVRPERSGARDLDLWCEALENQVDIVKHPLCLHLVSAMHIIQQARGGALDCQSQISHIESQTGFYPWADGDGTSSLSESLEKLSLASTKIGTVLVTLGDHVRQIRLLQRATESLFDASTSWLCGDDMGSSPSVMSASYLLQQQMDASEVRLDYLRVRAQDQLTVVSPPRIVTSRLNTS